MKKILFLIIFLLIITLIVLMVFLPKEKYEFLNDGKSYNIKVPKKSYLFKNENFRIEFKSLSTIKQLESFKDEYLNSLLLKCSSNNIDYYYDVNQNITLYNYNIVNKFIFNNIYVDYYIGDYCNDKETDDIENELKQLNFTIDVETSKNCNDLDILYSTDLYDIYTYCIVNANINIQNENMKLQEALSNNFVNIDKIIRKLEIESKYAETVKSIYDNDILYSNYNYSIAICNYDKDKTKYIIGDENLVYNSKLCN